MSDSKQDSKREAKPTFEIEKWNDIDDLLVQLARICINDNSYRRGDEFRIFTDREVDIISNKYFGRIEFDIDGGYMFLDESNGKTGMIKIFSGDCDPGYNFTVNDNNIEIEPN